MRPRCWAAAATLSALALAACATSSHVITDSASRSPGVAPTSTTSGTPTTTPPTGPATIPPATIQPATTAPAPPPPSAAPPTTIPLDDVLEIDEAKPPRDHDQLVAATLVDLERWWTEQYPALYGGAFEPLTGGVYPAYPERTEPIPGCGATDETTYDDIAEYGAFYCQGADFLAYDDGPDGILGELAAEYGPAILGVVLAHEYGHVVQSRFGALGESLPTITTEQQADCFAGAWVARAVRGKASGVTYTDADVRTGLIAMISVRDPKGIDQLSAGGHGSAFDRVGAFQVGYTDGLERCRELLEAPLPLVPNKFSNENEALSEGNAPFGYGENELGAYLIDDLNVFWPEAVSQLGAELGPLVLRPVTGPDDVSCADPAGDLDLGAVFCPSTDEVVFDETFGLDLYNQFGDFSIGYLLGVAWAEAVQQALASPLEGEARALLSDCLAGAWVTDLVSGPDPSRGLSLSPGDLDEAIQTALVVGDVGTTDDVVGSGFEKIASFRQGVLEGLPACTGRLGD